jgi:hypothetical protein
MVRIALTFGLFTVFLCTITPGLCQNTPFPNPAYRSAVRPCGPQLPAQPAPPVARSVNVTVPVPQPAQCVRTARVFPRSAVLLSSCGASCTLPTDAGEGGYCAASWGMRSAQTRASSVPGPRFHRPDHLPLSRADRRSSRSSVSGVGNVVPAGVPALCVKEAMLPTSTARELRLPTAGEPRVRSEVPRALHSACSALPAGACLCASRTLGCAPSSLCVAAIMRTVHATRVGGT